jgi:hypothetical protein
MKAGVDQMGGRSSLQILLAAVSPGKWSFRVSVFSFLGATMLVSGVIFGGCAVMIFGFH